MPWSVIVGALTALPSEPVRCPSCGQEVPVERHCVRCGAELTETSARRGFAAAPNEHALAPSLVSTLFPQLPSDSMRTFRIALLAGAVVVLLLGAAGLFPIAVVASAILVPLLLGIYLYDVDLYEDEPAHVLAYTAVWGIGAGVGLGFLVKEVVPAGVEILFESTERAVLVRGFALPALALVLTLLGPLVLLPYRKFNDVLDGATFGVMCGATLVGAQLVSQTGPLFSSGLRPVGTVGPWLIRLTELAVALPLVAAGAGGATAAAFWLRYRAPVADRGALGPLGRPPVAVLAAFVAFVGAALGQLLLPRLASLALLLVLAAASILWLRRVLHVGLLQESLEIPIGPSILCANCGSSTPRHSFCGYCGISLRALPKARIERGAAPSAPT
jgi:hypothetical protein